MHFFKLSKNIWNVFVVNLNILCFKGLKLFCFSFKQFKTILSFIWTRLKWMIPYFIGYLWCLIFIQSMIFFVIVSLNNNIFRGIVSIIMTKSISCSTTFKGSTAQVLIFYWLPPLIVKIDAVAFEVIWQIILKVPQKNTFSNNWPYHHTSKLYCARRIWKKYIWHSF